MARTPRLTTLLALLVRPVDTERMSAQCLTLCVLCVGKYSSVGSSEWASCAAGRYSADIGAFNCTVACLSGFYSSTVVGASVAKCSIVPAGSYPSENITYSSISASWKGFAASADFTKMVATVSGGYIQISSDSGSS